MIALPQVRQLPRHEIGPTSESCLPQHVQCRRLCPAILRERLEGGGPAGSRLSGGYYRPTTLARACRGAYRRMGTAGPTLDGLEDVT